MAEYVWRRERPLRGTAPRGTSIAAFVRRHKLAPYLLLAPALAGIALVLLWPLIQVALYSFQNYGLPQITGAVADAVGGARQLQHHLRRSRVLALAADHGAVRSRGRAAHPDHRHAGRPAAATGSARRWPRSSAPRRCWPGPLPRSRRACCSTGCSTPTAGWSTGRSARCRTGWSAAPTGLASTGPPAEPCTPTPC